MQLRKNYRLFKIAGHTIFWICCLSFALFTIYVVSKSNVFFTTQSFSTAFITNFGFAIAVYVNLLVLIPKLLKTKNYIFYTFWLLTTMALSALIIKVLLYFVIDLQFARSLYSSFFFTSGIYVGVTSLAKFVTDWLRLQDISLRYHKVEREKLEAELNTLKSQINPHFLFNSLNNIYSLSIVNSKETPVMILKLSDLMRHVLYESRENFIPLKKEIEFVKNFIELQRIRLIEKVDIQFQLDGTVSNKLIIPLIFEPFIDNAFKHGNYTESGESFVHIYIRIEEEKLFFRIGNSYEQGLSQKVKSDNAYGIGLKNAQKRLEYLYKKNEYKLNITQKEDIFNVELELNLKDK